MAIKFSERSFHPFNSAWKKFAFHISINIVFLLVHPQNTWTIFGNQFLCISVNLVSIAFYHSFEYNLSRVCMCEGAHTYSLLQIFRIWDNNLLSLENTFIRWSPREHSIIGFVSIIYYMYSFALKNKRSENKSN